MKRLFLVPLSGKFIVAITFLFAAIAIYSCSKDNTVDTTNLAKVSRKQNLTNLQTVENALVQMSGGDVDDVLYNIESALNEAYSYGDQSVMNIEETETELSFPISNGTITSEQAENIYTILKNTWADAYDAFDGENKKAFFLDVEKMDNADPNEVAIKIRATICEPQELGAPSPCDDVTFNSGSYQTVKTNYSPKNLKYAQNYLTAKLNQKLHNDPCTVFDDPVFIPFVPEIAVSKPGVLNATQMEETHCQLWNLLTQKFDAFMTEPANKLKYRNYVISGVVVTSAATLCTNCANPAKLIIKGVYISKKRIMPPPCIAPKTPPIKG